MSTDKDASELQEADEKLLVLEYIKSALFRVVHSDGAIGGLTPAGNVHFALYSDRPAIPRLQVHRIQSDGQLGDALPDRTVVRPGIIREMDVDVIMSPSAARSLGTWLIQTADRFSAEVGKIAEKGLNRDEL